MCTVILAPGDRSSRIPKASWLAGLAKSVSSRFNGKHSLLVSTSTRMAQHRRWYTHTVESHSVWGQDLPSQEASRRWDSLWRRLLCGWSAYLECTKFQAQCPELHKVGLVVHASDPSTWEWGMLWSQASWRLLSPNKLATTEVIHPAHEIPLPLLTTG